MHKFLYKILLFSTLSVFFSEISLAQPHADDHNTTPTSPNTHVATEAHKNGDSEHKTEKINAKNIIFEHILDAYSFHFFDLGGKTYGIDLPVVLYSKAKGLEVFSSAKFHHGHETYNGYRLIDEHFVEANKTKFPKIAAGQLVAIDAAGMPTNSDFYDLSLTRNMVQMFLALAILAFILIGVASKYKKGIGVTSAPKGFFQNAFETIIIFVRDDVAKANIGKGYQKYVPFLLTIFFFILINNIFGLIPGTANVTGNIAVTAVLGIITFIVVMASTNKHFWGHIFWPPVPHAVKPILVPVEFLGIFTKHVSLIVRLFANMVAGHVIIISLISLIFIFKQISTGVGIGSIVVALPFTVFIYVVEVLVAFLQAFIFSTLAAVFISQSREGHDNDHAVAH